MKRILVILAIVVLSLLAAFYLLGYPGGMAWFSPDTLQVRTQSERLLILVNLPLYRSAYEYRSHELADYLVKNEYWRPRTVDSPRWLILWHWNKLWRDGDSYLYISCFGRAHFWTDWTERNPKKARRLWPQVLEWLRDGDVNRAVEELDHVYAAD